MIYPGKLKNTLTLYVDRNTHSPKICIVAVKHETKITKKKNAFTLTRKSLPPDISGIETSEHRQLYG